MKYKPVTYSTIADPYVLHIEIEMVDKQTELDLRDLVGKNLGQCLPQLRLMFGQELTYCVRERYQAQLQKMICTVHGRLVSFEVVGENSTNPTQGH